MDREFWIRWWIPASTILFLLFASSLVPEASDMGAAAVARFLVALLLVGVSVAWFLLTERNWARMRDEVPRTFSLVWGRTIPAGWLVAMGFVFLAALSTFIYKLITGGTVRSAAALERSKTFEFLETLSTVFGTIGVAVFVAVVLWFVAGGLVVIALWIARIAEVKGRSRIAWFWLGLLFPLVAWIIVSSMASESGTKIAVSPVSSPPAGTKTCPYCAETVLAGAVKCKHCGEFIHVDAEI